MPGPFDGANVLVYVDMAEPVNASLTLGTTNSAFTVTADEYGTVGNSITVAVIDRAGNSLPLSVDVSGTAITVNAAVDGTSTITSTAAQVVDAINNDPAAKFLVTASLPLTSNGSGVVSAAAATPLTGGAAAGTSDFQPIAGQQDFSPDSTMDTIDANSKGDRFAITLAGRQSGSFEVTGLLTYQDDTQRRLERGYQRREDLKFRYYIPANVTGGAPIVREALCQLNGFTPDFPDSGAATFSAPVGLKENWRTI